MPIRIICFMISINIKFKRLSISLEIDELLYQDIIFQIQFLSHLSACLVHLFLTQNFRKKKILS